MSDDDDAGRTRPNIPQPVRVVDDRTVEVDKYSLLRQIQRDSTQSEDSRKTQKIQSRPRPDHSAEADDDPDQETTRFSVPAGMLASLGPSAEAVETLEVKFEQIEDPTFEGGQPTNPAAIVEFVAIVEPDGRIRVPEQVLKSNRIRPGMRLKFVAFQD